MTEEDAEVKLGQLREELLPVTPGPAVPIIEKADDGRVFIFEGEPEAVCIWCSETLADHEDDYPSRPIPKMPCLGLKSGFSPRT